MKGESQTAGGVRPKDNKQRRMGDEMRGHKDKYEEMVLPLPPKFKAPRMEMYDGSKDPV